MSTPIDGSPDARPNPLMGNSQPAQSESTKFFPKVTPASVDLAKSRFLGPAHTTYTSPLGPTAGEAPISVSLLSWASPGVSESLCGTANDLPASTEREK